MIARLLDEADLRDYLKVPLAAARKVTAGRILVAGKIRWDRFAVDAWLDGLSGMAAKSSNPSDEDTPDAALARYLEGLDGAARH